MASNKDKFKFSTSAEKKFMRQLTSIAKETARLMSPFLKDGQILNPQLMDRILSLYSQTIEPWANQITRVNLAQLENRTEREWKKHSKKIAEDLKKYLNKTQIGQIVQDAQERQVQYIKSIPIEAGLRVQDLARRAAFEGYRPDYVTHLLSAEENLQVTTSRAKLIARTEIARANSLLVEAQSAVAGVEYYIWRTMDDEEVRHSHQEMDGQVCSFADPPEVPGEGRHGPGQYPNCRCYAEPIIPAAANEYKELQDYPDILAELSLDLAA